jgi:hypothetical protein
MNGRDRRYARRRQGSLKAKIGIASAVVVAGGAIGVAVAASNHSPSAASSAGYVTQSHGLSQSTLLSDALGTNSWSSSFGSLAGISSSGLSQMWASHHRQLAIQRGVVVLVTKKFIILESKNHQLHLWWLSGGTKEDDIANSMSGTTAMTGSTSAATAAMTSGNMAPAAATVATTTTTAETVIPETTTQTYTVGIAGTGITVKVTVTKTTAVVVEKTTTTTTTTVENAFGTPKLKRGDLALIAGFRQDGLLHAQKVLFEPLTTSDVTPTTTPSATPSATATSTSEATTSNGTESSSHW